VLLLAPDTSVTVSAQVVGQAYSNSQNNIWYRVTTRQGDSDVSGYVISAAIELIASEENQGAPPLITLTPTPRSG
jgi:hypothetical protein